MRTNRGLAVTEEHRELAESARAVLADRNAIRAARAAADGAPPEPPEFWRDAVNLGWLGLHLAEEDGGQGFGVPELAVLAQIAERVLGLPRG
jgi:3-oxochol-4-en-24-oyl-CoA dehydrogenase